jgi:hypothetical protein
VWDRLISQIAFQCGQLEKLIEFYRPVLAKCADAAPAPFEVPALAAMLHSFYSGFENIFKRIALELDGDLPSGESWHRELLDSMTRPGSARPAVITSPLAARLNKYLQFRHVFRSVYAFLLTWDRMAPLVMDCEATLRQFRQELDSFVRFGKGGEA